MSFAAAVGLATLLGLELQAEAQVSGRDSVAMLAHWRCAVWAGMTDNEGEAERHFTAGLDKGRRFIEAARAGQISADEWQRTVPIGVSMTANGPTTDFVLGRLFEFASDQAFRDVAQRDDSDLSLAPSDYVSDPVVQRVKARSLFDRSNCSVL